MKSLIYLGAGIATSVAILYYIDTKKKAINAPNSNPAAVQKIESTLTNDVANNPIISAAMPTNINPSTFYGADGFVDENPNIIKRPVAVATVNSIYKTPAYVVDFSPLSTNN